MKICKVKDLTEKSFNKYTGPSKIDFNTINIIFGYNGRGKSSLADGIIEEFKKDLTKEEKNYRFFNREYIDEHLLISADDKSKIKGVIAKFGKTEIDADKKIAKLESEKIDIESLDKDKDKLLKLIRDEIDRIFDSKKGSVRIQKIPYIDDISSLIDRYKNAADEALKMQVSKEELLKISGNNSFEYEIQQKRSVRIGENISNFSEDDAKKISEIFNKKYDDIQIPSPQVIKWLNEGITIHKEDDECKFCSNELDYSKIKLRVKQYNDNEKQKDINLLTQYVEALEKIKIQTNDFIDKKNGVISTFKKDFSEIYNSSSENIKNITSSIELINEKIQDINSQLLFNKEYLLNSIGIIISNYDEVMKITIDDINDLEKKQENINKLVKGSIGLEIIESYKINKEIQNLTTKITEISNAYDINNDLTNQINDLKIQNSNMSDFAKHLNKILDNLEINLKLVLEDGVYVLKHSKIDKILTLGDISEGEKNLLALIYFYYELFEDDEQNDMKKEIELIVMDDPVSSVDDMNKMYILGIVKSLFKKVGYQIFVFTHVWEDFSNLAYAAGNSNKYSLFEIKKNDSIGSYIVNVKKPEIPYKHEFKEIYKFSNSKKDAASTDCQIYHYPNSMRKIIEEFLNFKSSKNYNATAKKSTEIAKILFNKEPSASEISETEKFLNICNVYSHKISRKPDEILLAAKFLMKRIEEVDKYHFDSNKA